MVNRQFHAIIDHNQMPLLIHSYGTGLVSVPEIEQELSDAANSRVTVSFTPTLMPMVNC